MARGGPKAACETQKGEAKVGNLSQALCSTGQTPEDRRKEKNTERPSTTLRENSETEPCRQNTGEESEKQREPAPEVQPKHPPDLTLGVGGRMIRKILRRWKQGTGEDSEGKRKKATNPRYQGDAMRSRGGVTYQKTTTRPSRRHQQRRGGPVDSSTPIREKRHRRAL